MKIQLEAEDVSPDLGVDDPAALFTQAEFVYRTHPITGRVTVTLGRAAEYMPEALREQFGCVELPHETTDAELPVWRAVLQLVARRVQCSPAALVFPHDSGREVK